MTATEHKPQSTRTRRGWVYAASLFLLSPLVGEFLLGNLPITWLWVLLVLAPLYGGGTLLIREVARRWGWGWPGIFPLALAYAVVEEAFTTQSLFNPNYLGLRLLDFGYIPALGMGGWWTVFVLGIHVIWSVATPIALVEALSGPRRRVPWLGRPGLLVTFVIFALGCLATTSHQLQQDGFRATTAQLIGAAAVVILLIVAAFLVGRGVASWRSTSPRTVPSPRALLGIGLALGSIFIVAAAVLNAHVPIGLSMGSMLATLAIGAVLLVRWSGSAHWTFQSETAFAGGVLLTYVWYGFVQVPSVGAVSPWLDTVGNAVFSAGALLLLIKAWKTSAAAG